MPALPDIQAALVTAHFEHRCLPHAVRHVCVLRMPVSSRSEAGAPPGAVLSQEDALPEAHQTVCVQHCCCDKRSRSLARLRLQKMGSVAVRVPLRACRPALAARNSAVIPITCSGDASSKAAARRKPLAAPPSAQRGGEPGPLSSLLQPFQTTSQDRSEVASAPQLSPATLLLAAGGGLAVVAGDVFAADSLHLLAFIDASAHAWVSTTAALYPAELQSLVAGAQGVRQGALHDVERPMLPSASHRLGDTAQSQMIPKACSSLGPTCRTFLQAN